MLRSFAITKPKIIFLPRFTSLRNSWERIQDLLGRNSTEHDYLAYRCLLETEEIVNVFQKVHIVNDENRENIIQGLDTSFRENFDEIFLICQRRYFEFNGSYVDKLVRALEFITLLDLAHSLGIRRGKIFSPVKELPRFIKEVDIDEEKIKNTLHKLEIGHKKERSIKLLYAAATIAKLSSVFPESNPILQNQEKQTQEYMEETWPELISGPYDSKTENRLVWAYKIYCSVFGHSQKLLMELEDFLIRCLSDDLRAFQEESKSLVAGGNYPEALNMLQTRFWLCTPKIEEKLAEVKDEFVKGARETYIKRIKNEDDLYRRHEMAESAVATLDGFITRDDPLIHMKNDFSGLIEQLDTFIHSGKKYQEEGDCKKALQQFYSAQAIWHHPDALLGAKAVEEKVQEYQKMLEKAEEERNMALRWLAAQKALSVCPKGRQALDIANEIEDELLVTGNLLQLEINDRIVRWYTQTQLTLSRDGGDIYINCKSMSGENKPIIIGIDDTTAWIEDRGSSNGAYIISPTGEKKIAEASYAKIPSNERFEIENEEGELLLGGIVRLLFRKQKKCLLLKLASPYPPQRLWPDTQMGMQEVWPNYEKDCEIFHLLSPIGVNLGLFLDTLGKELYFPAIIRWFRGKYILQSKKEPIEINGLKKEKVPLLHNLIYQCNGKAIKALSNNS